MSRDYDNNQQIERFLNNCIANGIGKLRVKKYQNLLSKLSEWLVKKFDKANKEDIEKVVKIINEKDYSDWTKRDYKVAIKKFYKWLNGGEEFPKTVRWIKLNSSFKKTLPQDLLTEDEIKRMIQYSSSLRNKAFVMTLYETGCRIGEMLSLRVKNVQFEKQSTVLNVTGKTGDRRVLVIMATPYLRDWLNNHPESKNPDSPLWIMANGEQLNNGSVRALLEKIKDKAGIKKRIYPHLFRHSRATHLANYLTEAQMKEYLGWTQSSDMPSVYVHLSGRDTDKAIRKMNGLKVEEKEDRNELKPQECMRCNEINKATAKFCDKCGAILDFKTAIDFEEQRKDEKDILHLFVKKIADKNPRLARETIKEFPKSMLEKLKSL